MVKLDFTAPEFRRTFRTPEEAENFLVEFTSVVPCDCAITVIGSKDGYDIVIEASTGSVTLSSPEVAEFVTHVMSEMGFIVMVTESLDSKLN